MPNPNNSTAESPAYRDRYSDSLSPASFTDTNSGAALRLRQHQVRRRRPRRSISRPGCAFRPATTLGIAGFIITGTAPKQLLFRGIGPSLAALGSCRRVSQPDARSAPARRHAHPRERQLERRPSAGSRDPGHWHSTQNNLEAAIIETLDPGSYTVILRGMGMTTGVGLVEVYDLNQGADSKLANLSTRAFVDTGNNIVIAGFVLGGTAAVTGSWRAGSVPA